MQIIWHINQSKTSLLITVFTLLPSCSEGSPHLPTLSNHMFRIEHVVRLGRLQQEKKTEKGGNEKTEEQGRRGSERYSSKSIEARQNQRRNPPHPSSQMNISACLLPRLHLWVFSSPPLFISMLPVPSTQLQLPLQQICRAPSSSLHLPSIQSWAWRIQAGPFLLLRRKLSPL